MYIHIVMTRDTGFAGPNRVLDEEVDFGEF